ncbi:sugar ABC transporter ATP-binding protein [Neobacillus notoginsengisoli]|uniref:Sugar ABC transporter ATP-binding protein n=2 Tax=Neobacillus notoginsengisoli TaxID=1578198 RepID=A0A417YIG3_9BACI|nr:sugar ABC transporter ATP-binding protein [Neobacillus notoginsengisoli]
MKAISKTFPGVKALQDVDFDLLPGEVHALLGENGAGKSTLVKIISGVYQKDHGEFVYKGKSIHFSSPLEAREAGISTVYQELSLMEHMDIGRNIFLGREGQNRILGILDKKRIYKDSMQYLKKVKLNISPYTLVKNLSIAEKQLVEIAKAISFNAEVIIFDEPTSSLSEEEANNLFILIEELKKSGIGIIYISHKMSEIAKISDRITVFRDGKKIATKYTKEITIDEVLKMMVGREISLMEKKIIENTNGELLRVKNLSKKDSFQDISFYLNKGEILGFAGLVGAGRTEVMRAIYGADKLDSGEIMIDNKLVHIKNPHQAIAKGIVLVPEDRKGQGLFLNLGVDKNITISSLKDVSRFKVVNNKKNQDIAKKTVEKMNVKTPTIHQQISLLSGGNQQKCILGRCILLNPKVLIFDEPTRGIDVGAKSEIYKLMFELAEQGIGIIVVSSELPEIMAVSDRVVVMHEGKITGELKEDQINQENIINYMVGVTHYV